MINRYRFVILLSALVIGLGNSSIPAAAQLGTGEFQERGLQHDGFSRAYSLYVPSSYDGTEKWPLVLSLHGFTWNPSDQAMLDQLALVADSAHFLIAYPLALDISIPPYHGNGWNVDGTYGSWDDIAFVSALIDDVDADYAVDLSRVHATGFSFGSVMSFALACGLSRRIASIGGVSGPMIRTLYTGGCAPSRAVSALLVHGTNDAAFPYTTGGAFGAIPVVTPAFWARHNYCSTDSLVTELPDLDTTDQSTVTLFEYPDCEGETEVLFYRINGGDHTWPGTPKNSGPFLGTAKNMDINASHEIWKFLAQHPHPQAGTIPVTFDVDVSALPEGSSDPAIGVVGSAPPLSWDDPIRLRQAIGPNLAGGMIWFPESSLGPLEYRFVHFLESGGYVEEWSGLSTRSMTLTESDNMMPVVFWNDEGARTPDPPLVVEPMDGEMSLTDLVLRWEPGEIGGRFEIELDHAADFQSSLVAEKEYRSTSLSVSVPDTLRTYFWRVRASNVMGYGEWTEASFSTVGTQALLIHPGDGDAFSDTTTTLTFRWHPYPSATRYYLQISDSPDFSTVPTKRLSATEYVDNTLEPDKQYFWRVTANTSESSPVWSFVIGSVNTNTERGDGIPLAFRLLGNYPNPFNPMTTISYDLPQAADVALAVYDVLGRQIREIVSGARPAGTYEVSFDASGLPSGVYFYRLQAGDYAETKRMVVVK
ncbi:MAG: T9SS type A sorting domain-containing protein, partial [Rhodothermales bacterium]|nr:T9SS type A sorting domain-containing protein [Rhodothermales bacterium]